VFGFFLPLLVGENAFIRFAILFLKAMFFNDFIKHFVDNGAFLFRYN
jgi:hypothetical protein